MMPKVSVIIPVYNVEKYLRKCLDSVCNQTLKDIEIICVNDCSSDNSLSILQYYALEDSRIKIINFTKNKGSASARNLAIKEASGEYIGFIDSDDYIDLDFYEKLYFQATSEKSDIAKGNIISVNDNYEIIKTPSNLNLNPLIKKHKAYFYSTFTTAIYRKSVIIDNKIDFLEEVKIFEDPYFSMKLMSHVNKVSLVENVNYYYLSNPSSQTKTGVKIDAIKDMGIASLKVLDYFREINLEKEHYVIVFSHLLSRFMNYAENINYDNNITKVAIKIISSLMQECIYLEDCLNQYYLNKKDVARKEAFMSLRKNLKK